MPSGLRVLWASDGSDSALAAAPLIESLLLPVAASVHVLTVAGRPTMSGAHQDPMYIKRWSREERTAALNNAVQIARYSAERLKSSSGVAVESQARSGHAVREILRAAKQESADVIVLGAKGHSALKMMLLGSVAQSVLEYARCPVLLARAGPKNVKTAVIGIDGSKESLRALTFLQNLSLDDDALLLLVRVVELISKRPSVRSTDYGSFAAEVEKINDDAMKRAEQDLAAAHGVLTIRRPSFNELTVGRAGDEILKLAALRRADLIVVGSRSPSRVRKYLVGSTAELIAREALTSVLVVR
jgi:nucleotide-binding universal stress UspA family protein